MCGQQSAGQSYLLPLPLATRPTIKSNTNPGCHCRGPDDEVRLRGLQAYAAELGLSDHVEWYINVPYAELKAWLGGAVGGLHTMLDEHFGISVVEYMAAGESYVRWGRVIVTVRQ